MHTLGIIMCKILSNVFICLRELRQGRIIQTQNKQFTSENTPRMWQQQTLPPTKTSCAVPSKWRYAHRNTLRNECTVKHVLGGKSPFQSNRRDNILLIYPITNSFQMQHLLTFEPRLVLSITYLLLNCTCTHQSNGSVKDKHAVFF